MSHDDALFSQLDAVFAAILSGMSPAGRQRTARSVGTMLRRSQSQRIGRQEAPDGAKFPTRRRRVLRSQAGIGFVWQGENRRLRNWRAVRGRRGRMLTGFDEERGAVRSFYREDIERYLDINFNETRRNATKADPMFRRLRTARFLKTRAPLTVQRWVIPAWLRVLPASISSACATKSMTAAQWQRIPAASCWA